MDLWAGGIRAAARNGVGLSPVSVVSHCEQVTPPYTPWAGEIAVTFSSGKAAREGNLRCFSTTRSLAHATRPDCDPSRSVLAWPLRHRPLLDDAGCVPFRKESSSKEFWTGTDLPR
jgi:hypothetical protein